MFPTGPKQPLDDLKDSLLDRLDKVRALVAPVLATEYGITDSTTRDDIVADLINRVLVLLTAISDDLVSAETVLADLKAADPACFADPISSHQATPLIMQMSGTPD